MAISKPGIVGQISGRLGSTEFAQSKGRQICKSSKGKRPGSSPNRFTSQAQHAAAIRYFNGLSDANKLAWETLSKQRPRPDRFGVPRPLSALQLFLTIPHDFRFSTPEYYEDTPPLQNNAFRAPVTATWTSPYDCRISYSVTGEFGDNDACALFASRFQKPSQKSSRNWRKVGMYYGATDSTVDFDTSLEALNIAAVSGESISLRFQWYRHGFWPLWYDIGQITVS